MRTNHSRNDNTRRSVSGGCTFGPSGGAMNSLRGIAHNVTVHGTIRIRLSTYRATVALPQPTSEHGGLTPVPAGHGVLVDIGRARYIEPHTAVRLAEVLRDASRIEVIGDEPDGVQQVRGALNWLMAGRGRT